MHFTGVGASVDVEVEDRLPGEDTIWRRDYLVPEEEVPVPPATGNHLADQHQVPNVLLPPPQLCGLVQGKHLDKEEIILRKLKTLGFFQVSGT